jgi:hypothetical protein
MRMPSRSSLIALAAVAAACGSEGSPPQPAACETPTGCVRADRVGGTCTCLEWQVVSIEPVPVKYLVVGVAYRPLGNQSSVTYGFTPSNVEPPVFPASSNLGARWRSVIRAGDGSEIVATVGPGDLGHGIWGPMMTVTPTSAALVQPANAALTILPGQVDVSSHESDQFFIWINPAAAVVTNYAGEKSVSWSWTADCILPGNCPGPTVYPFTAAWLHGTDVPPVLQAALDAFDATDRAAILAHDPFFDPPGRDPATIAVDPRFRSLGTANLGALYTAVPPVTWTPCTGTLTDDTFLPLTADGTRFGAGETLVVQHAVLSTAPTCTPQRPGLHLESSTPGCSIVAEVLIDTMFGTLLTMPTSVGASCSAQ